MGKLKKEYTNQKWKLDKKYKRARAFLKKINMYDESDFTKPVKELKVVSALLNAAYLNSKKFTPDKGITYIKGETQLKNMNKFLTDNGVQYDIPTKSKIFIFSMQAKKTKFTSTPQYWVARAIREGCKFSKCFYKKHYSTGASIIERGDMVSYTHVFVKKPKLIIGDSEMLDLLKECENPLNIDDDDFTDGNKIRQKESKKWHELNSQFGEKQNEEIATYFKRFRQYNNPYYIIGEMKLMRKYPHVLHGWLKETPTFKDNNPHYKDIMKFLDQEAKRRPDVNAYCTNMNHGAWAEAYRKARNQKRFGKSDGGFDINYLDQSDFGINIMQHARNRMKIVHQSFYDIDFLECNDFGPYQLITEYFLKHNDPAVWKWLLKDDDFGIKNIAIGSAKIKSKFRVYLIWYEDIFHDSLPTYAQKKFAYIGDEICLNQYNFRQRRCYDYDIVSFFTLLTIALWIPKESW